MSRPKLAMFMILYRELCGLLISVRKQKVSGLLIVTLVVFFMALVFSFLTYSPILSPFVYPLF